MAPSRNEESHGNGKGQTSVNATVFKGSKDGKVVKDTIKYEVGPEDVLIRLKYCGLCYTDVHYKNADMVLGHEGAGVVAAIGDKVTNFEIGDPVGWGYVHDSCQRCPKCLSGQEIFCPERVMYGTHDHNKGGFASHFPINQKYVFSIPKNLPLQYAAPMMCAGATVFSPLWEHVKPTDHVGIIGVGGLGHIAIQFAHKMGCEVTVFSGTDSKREEALKLGADRFIATKGKKELDLGEGARKLNALIASTSALPDFGQYYPILDSGAAILPLSVTGPEEKIAVPYMQFLQSGFNVIGSIIAPRHVHMLMLDFVARHKIYPMIEEFPMTVEGLTEAFSKIEEGSVRYRAVLKAQDD